MKKKLFILFFIIIAGLIYYNHVISTPLNKQVEDHLFVIESGQGVKVIAKNLQDDKLIKSKFFFELYIWRNNLEKKIKAGSYKLNSSASIKDIVGILISGDSLSNEKSLTFIEGWNLNDLGNYLEKHNFGVSKDFLAIAKVKNYSNYFFLSGLKNYVTLEGFLFPDTYRVYNNSTIDEIIIKMLDNFDDKLTDQMRADIEKQGKTIYDIVTMASLIEKEVKTENDMKIVSGIFWDRIKNKQALESCATLAYALGENKEQYSSADTETDSPYNTYKYRGLPPGPICNPGINAIRGAIYPTHTDYNYFLTDPETDKTIFSASYDEHLRNKAKYLN